MYQTEQRMHYDLELQIYRPHRATDLDDQHNRFNSIPARDRRMDGHKELL